MKTQNHKSVPSLKVYFGSKLDRIMLGSLENKLLQNNYCYSKILKKEYPAYYKYGFMAYKILLQRQYSYNFRKYFQVWPYHYTITPFFKYTKQIHLKDTLFYDYISQNENIDNITITDRLMSSLTVKKKYIQPKRLSFFNDLSTILIFKDKNYNQLPLDETRLHKKYEFLKESMFYCNNSLMVNYNINQNYINIFVFDLIFHLFLKNMVEFYKFYIMLIFLVR